MKVVSSTTGEERAEYQAREALDWPLREAAANVLRVVRGAGKPHKIASLMQDVIGAYLAYRDAAGHYPTPYVIAEILEFSETGSPERWRASFPGEVAEEDFQRWLEDGSFDRHAAIDDIIRASLQICASRLVGQRTQERTAESALYEAIRSLEAAREITRKRYKPR